MSDETPNPTQLLETSDILALLPVGEKQLRNLINHKGLPCEGKGARRRFVWLDVLEWWVEYRIALAFRDGNGGNDDASDDDGTSESRPRGKEDIRQANLRKTVADANIKELELARRRAELISIADARARLDRLFGNLRSKLLGMAPKLASRLEAEQDRNTREAALKDELAALCREISTGAIVGMEDDPDAPEADAVVDDLSAAAEVLPTFAPPDFGL